MADEQEQNTAEVETTPTDVGSSNLVSMTQEKLDSLINSKFGAGADKATKELLSQIGVDDVDVLKSIVSSHQEQQEASKSEFDKLSEQLTLERTQREALENQLSENENRLKISSLAAEYGISDVSYFEHEYGKVANTEGFDFSTFMDDLKTNKWYIFGTIDERSKNLSNPRSTKTPSTQITMTELAKLPAAERSKYKPNEIMRG